MSYDSVSRRLFVSILGAAPLPAAESWEKKKSSQWSEKDLKKLLSDSPWCRTVSGSMRRDGGGGSKGGGMGQGGAMGQGGGTNRSGGRGGMAQGGGGGRPGGRGGGAGGMGGGGMGGMGGGMGGGERPDAPAPTALVRWISALPVREALLKAKLGDEMENSSEAREALGREERTYAIALLGLPPAIARMDPKRMQNGLKSTTTLARKDKAAIAPESVAVQRRENAVTIVYRFPKTDPISLEDKEIEFATRVGPMEFKRKFKLKDMLYNGKLEL